jgi:hypothetical protein
LPTDFEQHPLNGNEQGSNSKPKTKESDNEQDRNHWHPLRRLIASTHPIVTIGMQVKINQNKGERQ